MKETKPNGGWIPAAALAVAVALLLPLQMYFGNAGIYPFSFARLLPELVLIAFLFFMGFILIQKIHSFLNLRPSPLYTALLLCVYLESGILSLDIPELNGGFIPMLSDVYRGVFDACLWSVIIIGFLACARWLHPFLHWISLAIFVLIVASLADVGHKTDIPSQPRPGTSTCITSDFEPQPTVVANVKYSPTRNILIFILDSMPGLETAASFRTNAVLRAKFPGFTAYPNNIGMHECTKRGVPGIVTGRHYDPAEMSETEYPMTMYGTNSCVTAAVRAGWNVAFSPDLLPYGFINLPIEKRVARVEKPRARDVLAILRQSTEVPYLSLFDLTAFRLSPFFFKGPILYSRIRHAVKGRHSNDGFWGEKSMYPELAARPTSDDPRPFLGVFHSWGVHPPWEGDLPSTLEDKLTRLGDLMEIYRKRGLYNESTVVVVADHGLCVTSPIEGYPPSAAAFLMVKPEGARSPFSVSAIQTSHARIAPLVKAALEKSVTQPDCEMMLRCEKPLYRAAVREFGGEFFRDWK